MDDILHYSLGTEQDILDSLEKDEWKLLENQETWRTILKKTAKNTLNKDQRINIRMSKSDLESIKYKANEERMPYQTLISSIVHKYVTGQLFYVPEK